MRRAIFALSLLGGFLCAVPVAGAQQACVLAPNGAVVCGPIVQPGYGPPPYEPRQNFEGRRDRDEGERRGREDERRREGLDRNRPAIRCPANFTLQGGECKPYRAPPTCQKGFTVQDGVCKPYTGR